MLLSPAKVIFEDNHLLVVDKPSGVASAHGKGPEDSLDHRFRDWLKERDKKPGNVFLGVVQRIDRPVTGVLLFAKTSKAASRLAVQFRDGLAKKTYWAVVEPGTMESEGVMEDYLGVGPGEFGGRKAWITTAFDSEGKHSLTHFSVRKRLGRRAWVELNPKTGRTHQLRVQLGSRGYPILGDDRYGAKKRLPWGIALHARSLTVEHPVSGKWETFTAPVPEDWQVEMGKGWNFPMPQPFAPRRPF